MNLSAASTKLPSMGGQVPGRALPAASKDRTGRPKMECMYRMRIDDMPCRPKAPTRNSYWPPGTRKEVLNWSSSRMRNYMYALSRSSLEKKRAPLVSLTSCSTCGRGSTERCVMALGPR